MSKNYLKKKTICIVGCGMSGGTLVLELAKKKKFNLIVIDTDKLKFNFKKKKRFSNIFQHLSRGHPLESKGSHLLRAFGFGGSSNLWSGVITTLEKSDLNKIDKIGGRGISRDLMKVYSKAATYFDTTYDFIKKINKKLIYNFLYKITVNSNFFINKNFFVQTNPLRIRSKILDLARRDLKLRVIENASAISILSNKENTKNIETVQILSNNKLIKIHADIFVFCCGSLETPRLFLQSISQKQLNFRNKNIGRHLVDHPYTVVGDISFKKKIRLKYFDVFLSLLNRSIKYRLGFSIKDTKKGNHCIVLKPKYSKSYINLKNDIRNMFNASFFINMFRVLKKNNFLNIVNSAVYFFYEKLPFSGPLCKSTEVFCYLEQLPRPKSFVGLSKIYKNFRAIPIINWHVDKKEIGEFKRISNYLYTLFKKNNYLYKPRKITLSQVRSGSHHAGTMRISKNSKYGVLNKNLKVHNINNAYVCDASIIPYYGNSNPSFTLVSFAIRLSNFLNKSL